MIFFIAFFALFILVPFWQAVGLTIVAIVVFNFFYFTDTEFDIRHLLILFPAIQWILGPVLSYHFVPEDNVYAMKVPPDMYFNLAVPGTIAFYAGLMLFIKHPKINKEILVSKLNQIRLKNKNLDVILLIVGLLSSIFEKSVPEALRFLVFLMIGLQYVGLLMIVTNPYRKRQTLLLVFAGVYYLLSGVVRGGFGLIFNWLLVSYVIFAYFIKIPLRYKIITAVLAFAAALVMQGVKFAYREIVWASNKYSTSEKINIFTNLLAEREGISDEATEKSLISRINQGWIISEIIQNMEIYNREFLNGESINRALNTTFNPMYDNPMKAGGQDYFSVFTGRRLGETTSMNLSVLGEAYGNYGREGAFLFMFLWGFFLNISFFLVLKIIQRKAIVIFFIPMIYQQVIKAENDFYTSLNHLVKSSIFVFILIIGLSMIFDLKTKTKLFMSNK